MHIKLEEILEDAKLVGLNDQWIINELNYERYTEVYIKMINRIKYDSKLDDYNKRHLLRKYRMTFCSYCHSLIIQYCFDSE